VLFQHLFWFYSHPAVYSWSCPDGRISELIANFSRKNIFGYTFFAFSVWLSQSLGSLVWGTIYLVAAIVYAGLVFRS